MISFPYLILTLFIGVVMPTLGVLNGNKVKKLLTQSPELRISIYRQTIFTLLLIASLVFIAMWFNKNTLDEIGASFILNPTAMMWMMAMNLSVLWVFYSQKFGDRILEKIQRQFQRVIYLIPATKQQYHWSIALALVAGFTEELIFRGFLYEKILGYLPTIPALILVNMVFGLCHWGTGLKNALWSFGLGVVWSLSYTITDSLWLAMSTHIMVDLISMTTGYAVFRKPRHQQL